MSFCLHLGNFFIAKYMERRMVSFMLNNGKKIVFIHPCIESSSKTKIGHVHLTHRPVVLLTEQILSRPPQAT